MLWNMFAQNYQCLTFWEHKSVDEESHEEIDLLDAGDVTVSAGRLGGVWGWTEVVINKYNTSSENINNFI